MNNYSRAVFASLAVAMCAAVTPQDGRAEESGFYQPIFSDVHTNTPNNNSSTNVQAVQFGKVFTAGFQINALKGQSDDPKSGGFFLRPELGTKDELVLGVSYQDPGASPNKNAYEAQAKYTLENGLGFATGFYDTGVQGQSNVVFGRVNYDLKFGSNNRLVVSPFAQRNPNGDTSPGFNTIYINPRVLLSAGYDGEMTRGSFNLSAKKIEGSKFQPAIEVLYNDNSVGPMDGARVIASAATLSYAGGFLDPYFSFGRASGPTNVTFTNPVSFTSNATWNRFPDVWEYGNLSNARVLQVRAGGTKSTDYSGVVYPGQLVPGVTGPLSRIFAGYRHVQNERNGLRDSDAPMVGYSGSVAGNPKLIGSGTAYYDFQAGRSEVVFGLVYLGK